MKRSYEKNFIGPQRAPSGNVPRSARNGQCPRGYNRNHTTGQCTRGRYSLDVGPKRLAAHPDYIPYPNQLVARRRYATRRQYSKRRVVKRRKTKYARCEPGHRRVGTRCMRTR